jgi:hypothetical protein
MSARARRTGTILAAALSALVAIAAPGRASGAPPAPIVVGIVLREGGPAFAMIQDPVTSTTGFYRVGARIGSAVVKEILADRVILVAGDQHTQLRLATPVSSANGPTPTVAPTPRTEPSGPGRAAATASTRGAEPPASPYGNIATVTASAGSSMAGGPTGGGSAGLGGGASQTGAAGAGGAGTQKGLRAALMVTGHLHDGSSRQGAEFTTTSLRDLLISMTYSNVTDTHRQRVELYAPDGSLYQKLSGVVAPSTQTLVPVGGTWITQHSLFGAWRVDVYVDRETTPIVSEAFTLTP